MKLNRFLLAAVLFCAPTLVYPMHIFSVLKAIIRIERYEKPGCATVDLCHDYHWDNDLEQEKTIIEALSRQKGHVYVEDMTEHVGSKHIQDSLNKNSELWANAQRGDILGLAKRLRNNGISASSVECRAGMEWSNVPAQQIIADYRNIREAVKTENPANFVDNISNMVIKSIEPNEDSYLQGVSHVSTLRGEQNECGTNTLDVIALRELTKSDENKYKVLVAGSLHCSNVGLCLEQLGYRRSKCLEDTEKNSRLISDAYKTFLPNTNKSSYILLSETGGPGGCFPESFSRKSLSLEQIKEYFNNPKAYTISRQSWLSSLCRLKDRLF